MSATRLTRHKMISAKYVKLLVWGKVIYTYHVDIPMGYVWWYIITKMDTAECVLIDVYVRIVFISTFISNNRLNINSLFIYLDGVRVESMLNILRDRFDYHYVQTISFPSHKIALPTITVNKQCIDHLVVYNQNCDLDWSWNIKRVDSQWHVGVTSKKMWWRLSNCMMYHLVFLYTNGHLRKLSFEEGF